MRSLWTMWLVVISLMFGSMTLAEEIRKPVRLIAYQGGDYLDYYKTLRSTAKGLMELGVLSRRAIPDFADYNTQALWAWLSDELSNDQLVFVKEGFYSANWDEATRKQVNDRLLRVLNRSDQADMVLALGTWAGMDIARLEHHKPSLVMSTSNPIYSGIVKSVEDSGVDHLFAAISPDRHYNQIRIFHDLIGFKRLGVAYEDTLAGRSYAAIADIERLAKERGFEMVGCHTQSDINDYAKAERSLLDCYEYLSDKTDALFVTEQGGMLEKTHGKIVKIALEHKLPTFSQYGQDEVKKGYLMSASRSFGLVKEGRFVAEAMQQVINGVMPREINQAFEEPPEIYLNMKTAEVIGFHLNAYLLAAADKLYWRIETQE
jgi:ABC-type uncharacterized transport system substrate-binding protein